MEAIANYLTVFCIQVKYAALNSKPITASFTTPAISLPLDLAFVLDVSTEITTSDLYELRLFLTTVVKSLQLGRNKIR